MDARHPCSSSPALKQADFNNKQMPILVSMMYLLRHQTVPAGSLASEASRKMSIKNECGAQRLAASDRSTTTTIGPE